MTTRIACFGGVYNNYLALQSAIVDAETRGADALYCLGDLGAFGPHPDRVFPLLHDHDVQCIQGNYDHSIGHQLDDCRCGYTDPRDNHFAALSYEYTQTFTSDIHRNFLRELPADQRIEVGNRKVLMCHGSPRKTNEFLWESTSPTHFLSHLAEQHEVDVILATHTGIKWHRSLPDNRDFINVGVLGRPENDGHTNVWYTLLTFDPSGALQIEFIPVAYDYQRLAREMERERLPIEFIETIMTGWWTTCLEVMPAKERRRGKH